MKEGLAGSWRNTPRHGSGGAAHGGKGQMSEASGARRRASGIKK